MACCFLLPTDSLSIICNDRKEQKSYLPEQYLSAQPGGGSGLEGRTHTEREREREMLKIGNFMEKYRKEFQMKKCRHL